MRKYVVEFIGTFFLVLTVGLTVLGGKTPGFEPIAIGSVLAVMIFAGGHISGGHYNPGVTLGVLLRGKLELNDAVMYWIAQVIAGVVAAFVAMFLVPGAAPTANTVGAAPGLVGEFLFSFALVYVVLNVATAKGTEGNSFYGWAIGTTVLIGAYAVGPITGSAFNSAVAIGASLMGLLSWGNIWIYLAANLLGGAAAAYVFKYAHPGE